jgi:hypothetical protein
MLTTMDGQHDYLIVQNAKVDGAGKSSEDRSTHLASHATKLHATGPK